MSPGQHRGRPTGQSSGPKSDGLADHSRGYGSAGLDRAIKVSRRDWWSDGALLAIKQLCLVDRGFTSEHVVELVGEPHEPHLLGAVFSAAQRSGLIESVGAVIGRDGSPRRVWWAAE